MRAGGCPLQLDQLIELVVLADVGEEHAVLLICHAQYLDVLQGRKGGYGLVQDACIFL